MLRAVHCPLLETRGDGVMEILGPWLASFAEDSTSCLGAQRSLFAASSPALLCTIPPPNLPYTPAGARPPARTRPRCGDGNASLARSLSGGQDRPAAAGDGQETWPDLGGDGWSSRAHSLSSALLYCFFFFSMSTLLGATAHSLEAHAI